MKVGKIYFITTEDKKVAIDHIVENDIRSMRWCIGLCENDSADRGMGFYRRTPYEPEDEFPLFRFQREEDGKSVRFVFYTDREGEKVRQRRSLPLGKMA